MAAGCNKVRELDDWCRLRRVNLQHDFPVTEKGGLRVLDWLVREDRFVCFAYIEALLFKALEALKAGPVESVCLQTDWTGQVTWSDYQLGVVGLFIAHRGKEEEPCRRWKKNCAPLVVMMPPWESPPEIAEGLRWSDAVLRRLLAMGGLPLPDPLVRTVLGDWSSSLRKAATSVGFAVLPDLEHCARNMADRSDLPRNKHVMHLLLRITCFIPHAANVATLWNYLIKDADRSFADYCRGTLCHRIRDGQDEYLIPKFWSGWRSKVRAGVSASSQAAEGCMKCIKETSKAKNCTRSEVEFLESMQKRYLVATASPSAEHGFLGPSQHLRSACLALDEYSPDLWQGCGRTWKCGKMQKTFPTAVQILQAQSKHQQAIFKHERIGVMRTFWGKKEEYKVGSQEALDFLSMVWQVRSWASAREAWRRAGLIRNEALDEDQVQRFLHGLCLQDLGSKECTCELFRATGECSHLLAFVHHIDKNFVQGKLKPKKNPNTSGKRGRGRPRGWQNPDSDSSDCDAWLLWFSFLLFVQTFQVFQNSMRT